jgi:hypothetical protein
MSLRATSTRATHRAGVRSGDIGVEVAGHGVTSLLHFQRHSLAMLIGGEVIKVAGAAGIGVVLHGRCRRRNSFERSAHKNYTRSKDSACDAGRYPNTAAHEYKYATLGCRRASRVDSSTASAPCLPLLVGYSYRVSIGPNSASSIGAPRDASISGGYMAVGGSWEPVLPRRGKSEGI